MWHIEDQCPQCGGPVTLEETDRLLTCAYCKVRLYVATDGPPRYCLPVKPAPVGDIVMVPYWRVRAQHYRCVPWEVRSALIDLTQRAAAAPALPPNLGIRPQAVRLRFASASLASRFLPPSGLPPISGDDLHAAVSVIDEEQRLFETCVAASRSIVYLPVRLARSVFDAVLNRRLDVASREAWLAEAGAGHDAPPPVRFLPTLCPECGWQLEAGRDSLVLLCENCRGGWEAGTGALRPIGYTMLPAQGWKPKRHLPFWRVEARVEGLPLASRADLVRFANLPKALQPGWDDEPLAFWIPSFKAQPEQFLRFAQMMTVEAHVAGGNGAAVQAPGPAGPPPVRTCFPVTVPDTDLAAAVKVLVAALATAKTRVFPLLHEVEVTVRSARLVYLPVGFNGREYTHPPLRLVVQKNLLEWGNRL